MGWLACGTLLALSAPLRAECLRYRLQARVDTAVPRLSGEATFVISQPQGESNRFTFLLNRDLRLVSVKDGQRTVEATTGKIKDEAREFSIELAPGTLPEREVTVSYEGVVKPPTAKDPDWMGVLLIRPDEIRMTHQTVWCPAIPDQRVPFEATLTIPSNLTLVCPGELRKAADDGRETTWSVRCDKPVRPAFIAGSYVTRSVDAGGRKLQVCLCRDQAGQTDAILKEVEPILRFHQSQFGPPPFDTLAIAQMHVLNNRFSYNYSCPSYVVLPDEIVRTAGRARALQFRSILAHEIAHQWWGNCVAFEDDSWRIGESLAEFSSAMFMHHCDPAKPLGHFLAGAAERCREISTRARRKERIPLREQSKSLSYAKGPWVLAMLREMQGPQRFDETLRTLFRETAFRRVDRARFLKSFGEPNREPLDWFFGQWLDRTQIPRISVRLIEPDANRTGRQVEITQSEPAFRIPLEVEFRAGQRRTRAEFMLTQAVSRHRFDGTDLPDTVVLDPDHKLLFENADTLTPLLLELESGYADLTRALDKRDWTNVDAAANTLCDHFRDLARAMDPRLDEFVRKADLDVNARAEIEHYTKLRAEIEARVASADSRKALAKIAGRLGEAADEIHDAVRDQKPDQISEHVTVLRRDWRPFLGLIGSKPAPATSATAPG